MVDISTAMTAASAEGRRRGAKDPDKKGKSGRNLGIEPFDPAKYVAKEKAETASMWLVMGFSLCVALLSRYLLMPKLDPNGNNDLLWFGPLALLLVIPSLHRLVMPEAFLEHYTKGTWFKAGFLHTFAWLAFTFLLTNPPLGDIGSPEPSAGWTIVVEDGADWLVANDSLAGRSQIVWHLNSSEDMLNGTIWLMFALADNSDPNDAEITISITPGGGVTETLAISEDQWSRIDEGREWALKNQSGGHDAVLTDHASDRLIAVQLGENLEVGEYSISVAVSEDGSPWRNTDQWTWELTITNST
jgi:hypothetical protein